MPSVIIADPDPTSRKALMLWLVYKMGVDEIVQVADGEELIKQIEIAVPDIILMDWDLPHRPPLEYCQDVQLNHSALQWVILSVNGIVSEEARCWFPWFLQKGASPEAIFSLLKKVIRTFPDPLPW
ncbi:MAG: response regulator transcription factor [Anaerolineales bacterium]|nr:response regulator transcription factor [Anaerolineales bacterium]